MGRRLLVMGILCVYILMMTVSAASIKTANIVNCTLSDVNATCNSVVSASCNVYLTNYGDAVVNSVNFVMNGVRYTATSPRTGNRTVGYWVVNKTVTYLDGSAPITLDMVSADFSDSSSCVGSILPKTTTTYCFVDYSTGIMSVSNACSCTYTDVAGNKEVDNTRTYTHTPSSGCGNILTSTTYKVPEDYCDPRWVAQYTPCQNTFSDPADMLAGTQIKNYISNDPTCCGYTGSTGGAGYTVFNHNGGSDCTPPPDDAATFSCRLGFLTEKGFDGKNSFGTEKDINSIGPFNYNSSIYSAGTALRPGVEPLVFDVDEDGEEEIVSFDTSGKLNVYTKKMVLQSSTSVGGNVSAPAAFWGINDLGGVTWGNETLWMDTYVRSGHVPLVVVPVENGSNYYVKVFRFASGVPTQLNSRSFAAPIAGVRCFMQYCYFATTGINSIGYKYEPFGDTVVGTVSLASYYFAGWGNYTNPFIVKGMLPTFSPVAVTADFYDRTILWPRMWNASVYYYGSILATKLDMTPLREFSLVQTSINQLSYTLMGNPVSVGGYFYQSVREKDNSSTGSTLVLKVYVGSVWDATNSPDSVAAQVSGTVAWSGVEQSSFEGISNMVGLKDGYAGGEYNVLSRMISSDIIPYFEPYYKTTLSPSFTNSGTRREEFIGLSKDGDYAYVVEDSYLKMLRLATGTFVGGTVNLNSGSSCSGGGANYFTLSRYSYNQDLNHIYWGFYSQCCGQSGSCTWSNSIGYFDMDPTGIISKSLGTFGGGGYGAASAECWNSPEGFVCTGGGLPGAYRVYDWYNASRYDDLNTSMGLPKVIWYDSDNDIAYTQTQLFVGYMNAINGGTYVAQTLPYVSGSAPPVFNLNGGDVRYIPAAGASLGKKVKITTANPIATTITSTACANFIPLYYNTDSYIFGIVTKTPKSENQPGPNFGYCDFSDELNPVVYRYSSIGTVAAWYSKTNDSVNDTWTVAVLPGNSGHIAALHDGDWTYEDDVWYIGAIGFFNRNSTGGIPTTMNSRLITFDSHRDAVVTASSEYSRGFKINSDGSIVSSTIVPYASGMKYVSKADMDGDGFDDLVERKGYVNFYKSTYNSISTVTSTGENDTVIPVDLDGNKYTDLILNFLQQGSLRAQLSNTPVQAFSSGNASIQALRCTVTPDTGITTIQVVGRLPDPRISSVSIIINPGDGSPDQLPEVDYSGTYVYSYAASGTYNIKVQISQLQNSWAFAKANCTVTVALPENSNLLGSKCSLGADGEFDYTDDIKVHGWVGLTSSVQPSSGVVQLLDRQRFEHVISDCSYQTITATEKVVLQSSGGMQLVSGATKSYVWGYSVSGTNILNARGEKIGVVVNADQYHTMALQIDRVNQKMFVYMDGRILYTSGENDVFIGSPTYVVMSGPAIVDYIRVTSAGLQIGEGSSTVTSKLAGKTSFLEQCNLTYQQESADRNVRTAHPNLDLYCASLSSKVCSYSTLQLVTQIYRECAKEVYNYCVYTAYPREQGLSPGSANGIQGATVCSAVLGVGAGYGGIIAPTANVFWEAATSNLTIALVIIFIIVIVVPIAAMKNKR